MDFYFNFLKKKVHNFFSNRLRYYNYKEEYGKKKYVFITFKDSLHHLKKRKHIQFYPSLATGGVAGKGKKGGVD